MKSTWNLLKSKLEENKKDLIKELCAELIENALLIKSPYGCCGHIKNLPGTFYINCSKSGKPYVGTGKGRNNKSHYYWIPIVYKFKSEIQNYVVSLVREDLDVTTGNTHQNFTEIQIVKNLYGSSEIGGAYNPSPKKKGNCYILEHQFLYSYPPIVTKEEIDKPWGYNIKDIPILDMKDENYSPQKVAKFVWELIKKDLER